ncbi:MAG: PH domain-containing protein [Phycisphaerae bacterium]|nr:PH domain-containing protein [Phycisphaerae bacterium]
MATTQTESARIPRGMLAEGETPILAMHPSSAYTLVMATLKTVLWVPIPTVLIIMFITIPGFWTVYVSPMIVYAWYRVLFRKNTLYVLTPRRMAQRRGVLTSNTHYVPADRVQDLIVTQGLLQRLVGCGTIVVTSAGTDTSKGEPKGILTRLFWAMFLVENDKPGLVWANIDSPYETAEEIRKHIGSHAGGL